MSVMEGTGDRWKQWPLPVAPVGRAAMRRGSDVGLFVARGGSGGRGGDGTKPGVNGGTGGKGGDATVVNLSPPGGPVAAPEDRVAPRPWWNNRPGRLRTP